MRIHLGCSLIARVSLPLQDVERSAFWNVKYVTKFSFFILILHKILRIWGFLRVSLGLVFLLNDN